MSETKNVSRRRALDLRKMLGNPKDLAKDLKSYRQSAQVLSSARARLIDKYAQRWIAIHSGKVVADSRGLASLLKATDKLGLPRDQILVRYIDRNVRKLIL